MSDLRQLLDEAQQMMDDVGRIADENPSQTRFTAAISRAIAMFNLTPEEMFTAGLYYATRYPEHMIVTQRYFDLLNTTHTHPEGEICAHQKIIDGIVERIPYNGQS